ncbi:MAG: enoyl-CoA hydratase-related protein [Polyangiales bacterium]
MSFRAIRVEAREVAEAEVRTLVLNRPDRRNAISPEMANELLHALAAAEQDARVRVVVLTGEGAHFCGGGDLKGMGGGDDGLAHKGDYADLLREMVSFPKPLVAKVRGTAMGGGLGLVAACHFALAGEAATLGTPEVHRGLWPMMITAVLARTVNRRDLLEMMLLGDKLTAARAAELRLVNRAVPDDHLDAEVDALCDALAARSPTAVRHGLTAWAKQGDMALDAALPMLREALFTLMGTDDAREGIMAFMEKRAPRWTGR